MHCTAKLLIYENQAGNSYAWLNLIIDEEVKWVYTVNADLRVWDLGGHFVGSLVSQWWNVWEDYCTRWFVQASEG